ncbi:MAG TPA: glycosyltransferase [Mycobacteriales bacterium]
MVPLPVRVTVVTRQSANHVLAGFALLDRAGVVDLDLRYRPELAAAHPSPSIAEAVVDGRVVVAYDLEDAYLVDWDTRNAYLATVAHCFKRSFDAAQHAASPHAARIHPLGLVYNVTARRPYLRELPPRQVVKRGLRADLTPYWWRFEDVPRPVRDPRVLFAARAWDPGGEPGEHLGDRALARDDREPLNELRATCVRRLRREFGGAFTGGLAPTPYARAAFPDCVAPRSVTARPAFLALVRQADVCVATRGLFGSNGFKLGEYVAAAKAVVSEPLQYAVPGDFRPGRNYLGFADADECVEQVAALVADPGRAYAMKTANYRYYHEYVRPDRMVLKTLMVALEGAEAAVGATAAAGWSTDPRTT